MILVGFAFLAPPAGPAATLLRRAAAVAARPVGMRFRGEREVTILAGGRPRTHLERVLRDGDRLRIDFPGRSRFAGETVIERGGVRRLYLPARREIRALPAAGEEWERRLARFAKASSGRASVGPGPMVAGYETRLLTVYRPEGEKMAEFAIEPRRALVLRFEAFASGGRSVGVSAYKSLTFLDRIPAGAFDYPTPGWATVSPADDLRRIGAEIGVEFAALPAATGYRLEAVRTRGIGERRVLASFYGGRRGRLTLFAATGPLPSSRRTGKRGARSGVGIYGWRRGATNYALAAEASAEELAALAGQVTFDPTTPIP